MSINYRKYVDIRSGVGGSAIVQVRELIGRIFTSNPLVSTDNIIEYTSVDDVAAFFGTSSEEYRRAAFYFGWVSKQLTQAKKICFAGWQPNAFAARVFGGKSPTALSGLISTTAGTVSVSTGGGPISIGSINFSTATSYANIASLLQTRLRTNSDPQLTTCTVTYDSTNNRFVVVGGVAGAGSLTFLQAGSGATDVGNLLNLYVADGAIDVVGTAGSSALDAVIAADQISNNYGSFLFMATTDIGDWAEIVEWNASNSVSYQFMLACDQASASVIASAIGQIAGTAMTINDPINYPNEYPEMIPMIQLAATDYTKQNSTSNYMFQQFPVTALVTDTPTSDSLDAIRVNYYGNTQINGQNVSFYQRGSLFGPNTSPADQNVYGNEQWLSSYLTASFMNALLVLPKIDADEAGRSICLNLLQDGVDQALFNGTISIGKVLTPLQKADIALQSGDSNAWQQVQGIGYWYNVVIVPEVVNNQTIYKATYLLIYSKDDVIRKVEGTHNLI